MKNKKQIYSPTHILSSMFMLLALAWLTVCLPYVNESQQQFEKQLACAGDETPDTDTTNPLTNTNEERAESGTSLLSEYLHDPYQIEHNFITLTTFYKCHPSDLYHEYHPELLLPPPEAIG
ncbi:MAG: hypothetical protein M3Q06_01250 [Bacteroidota bacterium]|nr:hypothetical protein [Bacteroidota bacterium]